MINNNDLLTTLEAIEFIKDKFKIVVSIGNISYLIKYGQIKRMSQNDNTVISKTELINYYNNIFDKENELKKRIGNDLSWELSFNNVKEYERTKHVHRLHPYKGKFIPQLVEYFLDEKTNGLKKEVFFHPGDVVIDPFCGSGTTLVQANELGINSIGIDISEFNSLISNLKVGKHDLVKLQQSINQINIKLHQHFGDSLWNKFDSELLNIISIFNKKYFPTPEILYRIKKGEIEIQSYSKEKERLIRNEFKELLSRSQLNISDVNSNGSFINKWYTPPIKTEIIYLLDLITNIEDEDIKNILRLILSRTARTCRATTHSDLATLIEPIFEPYYCYKHNKVCKPLFTLINWWDYYANDTVKRLAEFSKLRTNTEQICITGDSRSINLITELGKNNKNLLEKLKSQKAKGIFTSPPYVGLIDYHEQHAYAYELFNILRRDENEIGPQLKGKGKNARDQYVTDISSVLLKMQAYLTSDCEILIVANDSYNLYPKIAELSGLEIINEYSRPVLNRTEKDKSAYSEKIFRMKLKVRN